MMKRNSNVKRITITALFTAVIFITTSFIKFPIAFGYVHLGDVFIMLASFMLPPFYAVIAAAIGSMFADLLAGFVIYMPITFFAKGVMALIVSVIFYKKNTLPRFLLGALVSSVVMVLSYFVFEGFVYGWAPAIANLPMQFIQPAVAIIVGGIMIFALKKAPFILHLRDEIAPKAHQKSSVNGEKGV
ncbi:MAG: ECF transporter S component [Clostridia bacterium]|nr:ECF transporter S component [Clostridia bacterium]